MTDLRWGLLATGTIAAEFAAGVEQSRHGVLAAAASRTAERARDFATRYEIPKAYGSYEELLADPDVDAVYVATPHAQHEEWAIRAAEAGKHVLCEKPLTLTAADAEKVIDAARRNDVFLMEAFMYRLHPQTRRLVELIESGAIGEVRAVDVTFSFDSDENDAARLGDPALGGGGILDVGCYCTSLARLVSQAATGTPAVEPTRLTGMARLAESGVDEFAMGLLRLPGDIIAQLSCGYLLTQDDHIRIYGTAGQLYVPKPAWIHELRTPGVSTIVLTPSDGEPEIIEIEATQGVYAREADYVAAHVANRQGPELTWAETLANMRTLDRWRAAVGYGR
ncbi:MULTISPECIES: Gfo/Idh/MocA family protein [Amycolatopsis]|uniref:Gfo/Idh/MocA family oxidoreductase n=1 Tax=Amycolatopsis dendrobii TaxID=2760662 RepID=A0A7W3W4I4_9PSEU|nr:MULTISPECIES: Gfo/Idh/MocA family oxidoreductase [Amycolatopsis]MBB1158701.1 Gfo/Idh/MocA family oxidoreductase [Amycolatopsis dendrobii]UKD51012.1 Gfo/Idh/MocA family oxidoreductase [Amycolatopsis sp. FU40]